MSLFYLSNLPQNVPIKKNYSYEKIFNENNA